MELGSEPLDDAELVYRRVPLSWYPEPREGKPSYLSFQPRLEDTTGISLSRAKYTTIEDAARGRSLKGFFVAVLSVRALREAGLDILPEPNVGDPGHCVIPQLCAQTKGVSRTIEWQKQLAEELSQMEGPFPSPMPS